MGVNAVPAVLAIDAGNSKTDAALVGADGSVLGTGRGGGFRPQLVGVGAAVEALAAAVGEAAREAGLADLGPPDGPACAAHVSACLANADLPVEEEELARAVAERGWGASVRVRNDTFAVLRAGVDEPRGVAVVCGAGINCVGVRPDGRTARFPAVGRLSGDWGGGWGLAEEALWYAARAEDGRGEPTELARALPAHFGLESMYALIEAVHLGRLPGGRRHELAPVVFAVGAAGDPVARALVERLAEEVVTMAVVALERLGLRDAPEPVPVVLGGSVLAAGHPELNGRIGELLRERAPAAVPRVVDAPPVLGAALLGLDDVGACAAAGRALRAHFAPGRNRVGADRVL
ncbi:BadF/BadG/BcrA/BcrD ATPase family protein [Streptomyces sp. TRM76323]|uniref:BadF/BadG/BcrA/BcrD ATPase family protein n=1 Tax=Streptomyces tamarix TaxID=3078565 RepID=A0ABU3QSX1_9ACTN|nr:BadF/BadG/BcrA/BcrD ATPase family protein [Streptomyces tamarix]MDT9685851.1 BadF/BadG/BcrA/BcrD ATPase family protein [Streptomyces tamarix]